MLEEVSEQLRDLRLMLNSLHFSEDLDDARCRAQTAFPRFERSTACEPGKQGLRTCRSAHVPESLDCQVISLR